MLAGDFQDVAIGLRGVLGIEDRGPPGGDVPLKLGQELVQIGDCIGLDPVGGLAPLLPVGDFGLDLAIVFAGAFGRLAQGLGPMGLVQPLGLLLEKCGPFEVQVFLQHRRERR